MIARVLDGSQFQEFQVGELIARVLDGSQFQEFKVGELIARVPLLTTVAKALRICHLSRINVTYSITIFVDVEFFFLDN